MERRCRGASNDTRRRPATPNGGSLPTPAASPPQPGQPQLELLVQQIQALTAAVQELRQAAPRPPSPRLMERRSRGLTPERPAENHHLDARPLRPPGLGGTSRGPSADPWRYQALPLPSETGSTPARTAPGDRADADLRRRIEELGRQLQALKGQTARRDRDAEFSTESPYSQRILEEPIPPRFKMPQIEHYDGSADPMDHLESFKALMMLQGASDGLLCKAFPATLRKTARLWFSGLQPGSVYSFEQLGRQFIAHFAASRRQHRSSDFLLGVRQREGESLRSYLDRFTTATLEVRDLNQSVAMSALKAGTRSYRLLFSMAKKSPADFSEMLAKARKYADAEEAMALRRGKGPGEPAPLPGRKRRHEERSRHGSRSPPRGWSPPR